MKVIVEFEIDDPNDKNPDEGDMFDYFTYMHSDIIALRPNKGTIKTMSVIFKPVRIQVVGQEA
jgi:hypothetical protein